MASEEKKNDLVQVGEESEHKQRHDPKSYAFATIALNGTDEDSNLSGALCLAWSLRETASKASRVLLCDSEIYKNYGKQILNSKLFDDIIQVDNDQQSLDNDILLMNAKLNCFKLTKYSKIAMLDPSLLCLKNCDSLFDMTPPAGIFSKFSVRDIKLQKQKNGSLVSNKDIKEGICNGYGIRDCLFVS